MEEEKLELAIALIKKGQREDGRQILVGLLKENTRIVRAWAWLYECVNSDEQRIFCLKKVVELNPNYVEAKEALAELERKQSLIFPKTLTSSKEKKEQQPGRKPLPIVEKREQNQVIKTMAVIEEQRREQWKKPKPAIKPKEVFTELERKESLKSPKNVPFSNEKKERRQGQVPEPIVEKREQNQVTKTIKVIEQQRQKPGKKPKPAVEKFDNEQMIGEAPRVKSSYGFNSKKYKIVYIKQGDNQFAKKDKYSGLPNTEAAMLGSRLIIGGISITPDDFPKCIGIGRTLPLSQCMTCEFFSAVDCPLRHDPFLVHEAYILYAQRKRYIQEHKHEDERRRTSVLRAVYFELKEHGRPLHYEIIGKIISDRYPQLRLNSHKILHYMMRHPEKFEWVDEGVYKAK